MATGLSFAIPVKQPPQTKTNGHGNHHQKNGSKRPHAALGDDSDDEGTPSKQVVTHFDSKGAYNKAKPVEEKTPLVIKPQANRDWREAAQAAKRSKYGLPSADRERDSAQQEEEIRRIEEAKKPTFGLNVKSRHSNETAPDVETDTAPASVEVHVPQKTRTDDERAMDALLGIKQQSDLMIPAATEEEAFQKDFHSAPDMPTLEEYAAVPVEEFGAALLRGMGWRDGHGIGKQARQKLQKAKVPERRPALLGIGAKEDAAVKEEMGAWGRGAGRGKVPQVYNPVVMRNRKTGEEMTEEEVKAKVTEQEAKDREAELDALHRRRRDGDHERRREERRSKDDFSDEEYERKRRERRREREKRERERDHDSKDRRRSRDRDERRARDEGRDRDRRKDRRDDDRDQRPRRERSRDGSAERRRRRD